MYFVHVARMGNTIHLNLIVMSKPVGKAQFGRSKEKARIMSRL
jgi:hypothetical protein